MPQVTIEKLIFGGQAMGHLDGKVCFVWNALPGEVVDIRITKNKKNFIEGIAEQIITPSAHRVEPREKHYLACSPWQNMTFAEENTWKSKIAEETLVSIGKLELKEPLTIAANPDQQYGYRNKIEFSFMEDWNGEISLAFFERGQRYRQPIPGCELAEPCINDTAKNILSWLNEIGAGAGSLKSMIIRSNGQGEAIATLFVKGEYAFPSYPERVEGWKGFHIYYSDHRSPAAIPTRLLYTDGDHFLTSSIQGVRLKYGLLSFFQINLPVFDQALDDMKQYLDPALPLVDYYSGVGSIGLALRDHCTSCTLVDNNAEAIDFARQNIEINTIANCTAHVSSAERMTELISGDTQVVFDPPRAGLHPDVVAKVLASLPPRIIYLSCNVSTQARDIQLLSEKYSVTFLKLYNFFPRTPHLESLCVLTRR